MKKSTLSEIYDVLADFYPPSVIKQITELPVLKEIIELPIFKEIIELPIFKEIAKPSVNKQATVDPALQEVTETPVTEEAAKTSTPKKVSKTSAPEDTKPSVLKDITKPFILQNEIEPSVRRKITKTSAANDITDTSTLRNVTDPMIIEEIIEPFSVDNKTNSSPLPFISFVTLNRLGLTIKNLNKLLDSDEDFEMHIIDCNSKDDTWRYIKGLKDKRIKSRTRFGINRGPIYVLNYNLRKRKPDQYFFTIDSDVYVKTKDWIARYMEVFEAFPEIGLLGVMRDNPYPRYLPPVIPRVKGDLSYLQLKNGEIDVMMDFIPGCLQALRPELIKEIGYWSEEIGYGDAEISPRIMHYTSFKVGFLTTVEIDMTQFIGCKKCQAKNFCTLSKSVKTCFMLSKQSNKNESFAKKFKWKYLEAFRELEEGKRTAYCSSILDPESMKGHAYNRSWALENFEHYIRNSND